MCDNRFRRVWSTHLLISNRISFLGALIITILKHETSVRQVFHCGKYNVYDETIFKSGLQDCLLCHSRKKVSFRFMKKVLLKLLENSFQDKQHICKRITGSL